MSEAPASPMAIDSPVPTGTYTAQSSQDHTFSTRLIVAPPVKFGYGRKVDFLARLPYELSSRVVSFLDFQSLISISSVSRQWRAIYFDNAIWRQQMIERGWGVQLPAEIQSWDDHRINWHYLFTQKYQLLKRWQLGQVTSHFLIGHRHGVYCLQFDQEKIVTGSRDRTIKFWDMTTYQCVRTLQGHQGSVLCLKYNKDIMVSGSSDNTVIVWDMRTLQIIRRLEGHEGGVLDVCFDHRYIVSCSKDATIRIWDIVSGALVRVIRDHGGPVNTLQLCGDQIVSGSGDATVRMWNITTGTCVRKFDGHMHGVACVRYDGSQIVSGSNDRTIKVWDAETGKCTMTLAGHTDLIRTLQFADDKIISAGYDQTIRVWDMRTGACLLNFQSAQSSWIFNVQFDKNRIISVRHDCKIHVMNFAEGLDTRYIT
ncbi:WD40-repeat-containing domain protein [Fennellomyces sp. T-0311]|nr:WD40-repeat-containing domain protein [Fennellomyces sp. T-0311]